MYAGLDAGSETPYHLAASQWRVYVSSACRVVLRSGDRFLADSPVVLRRPILDLARAQLHVGVGPGTNATARKVRGSDLDACRGLRFPGLVLLGSAGPAIRVATATDDDSSSPALSNCVGDLAAVKPAVLDENLVGVHAGDDYACKVD